MEENMLERIEINSSILAGKPIIKGTRMSVEFILELFSSNMSMESIIKEYPHLSKQDILAAVNYAANIVKREEIISPLETLKAR